MIESPKTVKKVQKIWENIEVTTWKITFEPLRFFHHQTLLSVV